MQFVLNLVSQFFNIGFLLSQMEIILGKKLGFISFYFLLLTVSSDLQQHVAGN